MARFIKRSSKTIGLPPGSLVHVGESRTAQVKITVIDYDEQNFIEKEVSAEECFPFKDKPSVTWINVDGVHQIDIIEKIGLHFGLHPLVLEDIMNTGQRPKMEDFEDYIFIVLKMLYHSEKDDEIKAEQISLVLGKNFVLSFQETEGDVFDFVRDRLRNGKGRIRKVSADYLTYSLLDAIIDNYFIILEKIGEAVEEMEDKLIANPIPETLQAIHYMKRELIFLRKSVWPLREVISGLQRGESKLIHKSTQLYIRDMYDHTIQVIDTIETFRDMISGMLDIYMSSVSNKMNEVMKVLTIFAAIFIPLTFVAGVYGMNFSPDASPLNMPELNFFLGYPLVLILMASIGGIMLLYFKRKKWL
ncbi:MAG: magnesium/cobalt transporter CorA [Candidatus Thermoplasmatota archaeon]|nr:magnesium/cobalt transporter CorA [Candidatus Thermoplasmatota archaeon]